MRFTRAAALLYLAISSLSLPAWADETDPVALTKREICPFFSTKLGQDSRLFMNNTRPSPILVTLSARNPAGEVLRRVSIELAASSSVDVGIHELIGAETYGFIELLHTSGLSQLPAQIVIFSEHQPWHIGCVEERLLDRLPSGDHAIVPPVALGRAPSQPQPHLTLAFTNSGTKSARGSLQLKAGGEDRVLRWTVEPGHMTLVQEPIPPGPMGSLATLVLQRLEESSRVLVSAFVAISRTDGRLDTVPITLHPASAPSYALVGFLEGHHSKLLLWNHSASEARLEIAVFDGDGQIRTRAATVVGGQTRILSLEGLTDPSFGNVAAIQVNSYSHGQIVGEVLCDAAPGGFSPGPWINPLFDPAQDLGHAYSLPIRLSDSAKTLIKLFNPNNESVRLSLFLHFGTLNYTFPLDKLDPLQVKEVDLRAARDNLLPDPFGRTIPATADSGWVAVVMHDEADKLLLVQGLVEEPERKRTLPFGCTIPKPAPIALVVSPDPVQANLQRIRFAKATAFFEDFSQRDVTADPGTSFLIFNPNLASGSGHGDLTCNGLGVTSMLATYSTCILYSGTISMNGSSCLEMATVSDEVGVECYNLTITGQSSQTPGAFGTEPPHTILTVSLGMVPVSPVDITLQAISSPGSGGHQHEEGFGIPRPPARLLQGTSWSNVQLFHVTSQSFMTEFKPSMGDDNSARGIAGSYGVKVGAFDDPNIAFKGINVKFDLAALPAGGSYCTRSVDPNHNNGDYHYGTASANSAIATVADQFFTAFGSKQSPPEKIVVNDQSLLWGGLFEAYTGSTTQPWYVQAKGHREHRDGNQVDFVWRVCTTAGQPQFSSDSAQWDELMRDLLSVFNGNCLTESATSHFHCRR